MEPVVFEVAPGITAIDTFYGGRERATAAYLLDADEPAIVETGPSTSFEPVVTGLERLGIGAADLAHIAVTHIHLDHAGGVWRIAERFPNATVWVHERGARHLADPTRLLESVTSIYGPVTTASLFGPVEPVAAQRIRALVDGDRIELGGRRLEALATPGHAKHHVALADSGTGAVFTGDALGIHPPDARSLRPATPPPDYDLDLALDSIERIRERARGAIVLFSHFGPVHEVERICDLATERFRTWTKAVGEALERGLDPERDDALDEVMRVLADVARTDVPTGAEAELDLQTMETMSSIRLNSMGILGYFRRTREAERTGQAS
ncbi:MAG TPA: MBL fold metallo-hydrolase [Actinomycetota bacterium]|nr:MBL fold metallo-hydrolase [Actinomycetota bacterium]